VALKADPTARNFSTQMTNLWINAGSMLHTIKKNISAKKVGDFAKKMEISPRKYYYMLSDKLERNIAFQENRHFLAKIGQNQGCQMVYFPTKKSQFG
jgi:hypothetical protein